MRKKDLLATASDSSLKPPADFVDPRAFGLDRPAYSVRETLGLLPLGRSSFYAAVKDGRLKVRKFGKKTLVLAPDLAAFLAALTKAQAGSGSKREAA
jgi:hypothetical protein